jgi:hypothetical protein
VASLASWLRARGRVLAKVGRVVLLLIAVIAFVVLWGQYWHSSELERPESSGAFANSIAVGIGADAPEDTRVSLRLAPWHEELYQIPKLTITLGQSKEPAKLVNFRIEIGAFPERPDPCQWERTAHTCWQGNGSTVTEPETNLVGTTVISGTFVSNGYTMIVTNPPLGEARNGPYRSLYDHITTLQEGLNLEYPPDGIEVEVSTDVGSRSARYESFFPGQPHRLLPTGWTWLVPAPGSPIGMQVTDVELEQQLRDDSETAALVMGVLLGIFAQVIFNFVSRKPSPPATSAAAPPPGEGPPPEGASH